MTDTAHDLAQTRALLDEALALQKAGNLAEAEPRYRTVIEAGYRVAEILPILAAIVGARGGSDEALDLWDRVLAADPGNPVAHHEKGLIYSRTGRIEQAVAALRASFAADPENPVTANNLAVMLADAGHKS